MATEDELRFDLIEQSICEAKRQLRSVRDRIVVLEQRHGHARTGHTTITQDIDTTARASDAHVPVPAHNSLDVPDQIHPTLPSLSQEKRTAGDSRTYQTSLASENEHSGTMIDTTDTDRKAYSKLESTKEAHRVSNMHSGEGGRVDAKNNRDDKGSCAVLRTYGDAEQPLSIDFTHGKRMLNFFLHTLGSLQEQNGDKPVNVDDIVAAIRAERPEFLEQLNIKTIDDFIDAASHRVSLTVSQDLDGVKFVFLPQDRCTKLAQTLSSPLTQTRVETNFFDRWREVVPVNPTMRDETTAHELSKRACNYANDKFGHVLPEDVDFLILLLTHHGHRVYPGSHSLYVTLPRVAQLMRAWHWAVVSRYGFGDNLCRFVERATKVAKVWLTKTHSAPFVLWLVNPRYPFHRSDDCRAFWSQYPALFKEVRGQTQEGIQAAGSANAKSAKRESEETSMTMLNGKKLKGKTQEESASNHSEAILGSPDKVGSKHVGTIPPVEGQASVRVTSAERNDGFPEETHTNKQKEAQDIKATQAWVNCEEEIDDFLKDICEAFQGEQESDQAASFLV